MREVIGFLRFLVALSYVFGYAIATYIAGLFGKGEEYLNKVKGYGARRLIRLTGSTIKILGRENIDTSKNYIFVGNHRSYTDILALFASEENAGIHFSFMAKKELFRIPFLGKAMSFLRVVSVERGSASKAMKSYLNAIEVIKSGRNVVIFPEGTRSNDGITLHPFKKGAFTIAKRAEVDVIPFAVQGTEKYMPKKGFAMFPADISIKFFPPISTSDKSDIEVMKIAESIIKEEIQAV